MADLEDEPMDEPMDDPQTDQVPLAVVARHALHDEELIAAFAGGDLETGPDTDRARSLTERCTACRDLQRDIELIDNLLRAAGTAADVGARMNAPRDFRLTADDARRLGGRVPVGGLLERLRTSLTGFARPLGASMATLGVVGLLVGSMTLGGVAMPGSLAIDAGAPTAGAAGAELIPAGASQGTTAYGPEATGDRNESGTGGARSSTFGGAVSFATVLQAGSVALLIVGLALLVIGMRGRSRREE